MKITVTFAIQGYIVYCECVKDNDINNSADTENKVCADRKTVVCACWVALT